MVRDHTASLLPPDQLHAVDGGLSGILIALGISQSAASSAAPRVFSAVTQSSWAWAGTPVPASATAPSAVPCTPTSRSLVGVPCSPACALRRAAAPPPSRLQS